MTSQTPSVVASFLRRKSLDELVQLLSDTAKWPKSPTKCSFIGFAADELSRRAGVESLELSA